MPTLRFASLILFPALLLAQGRGAPGRRVLVDAHNCYPEGDKWGNRLERALSLRLPIAIEQDLVWLEDPKSGFFRSIVSHGKPFTGREPGLRGHFFERIRPIMERHLGNQTSAEWPILVLNLEFKTKERAHLEAVWRLLGDYEPWLTTAERTAGASEAAPLDLKPLLILTGDSDEEQAVFHDALPVGKRLRLFGAVKPAEEPKAHVPPASMVSRRATNYRRWWNNPWAVIEDGGPQEAGDWTAEDQRRLKDIVGHAHSLGLWIRFYTLNGHAPGQGQGWNEKYNFGSAEAVRKRWSAARQAGADFISTDQYEELARFLDEQ